jgi:2,5-dioxopentanoate dehydrogenase
MTPRPVLIAGRWRPASGEAVFRPENPALSEPLADVYPVSTWADCEEALAAATEAACSLRTLPSQQISQFLECMAEMILVRAPELVELAHNETGLSKSPRLAGVELPRTVDQLRQAAIAAAESTWTLPTIDSKLNIRSCHASLGPVAVFGPNNFPFAFNSCAGGDFASAIAAGNPVIAKANTGHPGTTRLFAEIAAAAMHQTDLPAATVQLLYRTNHADGERLVADARIGAIAYTGSRHAGLKLKAAADAAGKPIYLELSSVNPVLILPGALQERAEQLAGEFSGSCLLGAGQFCTNPGLAILFAGDATERFILAVRQRFESLPPAPLLSAAVLRTLGEGVATVRAAGAELLTGGHPLPGPGCRYAHTLLRIAGADFLKNPERLQTEMFGNSTLLVVVRNDGEATSVLACLEGNLTGCIYSHTRGDDDMLYTHLAPLLRTRVGRLINDKMPTGVAVSPAMNHGGPYPATGHPGFTAVGIPASLRRFSMLQCFDNVRLQRLPALLRDENPTGRTWRLIDGHWTQSAVKA